MALDGPGGVTTIRRTKYFFDRHSYRFTSPVVMSYITAAAVVRYGSLGSASHMSSAGAVPNLMSPMIIAIALATTHPFFYIIL